jgi:two-component sensor histidine kinase
LTGGIVTAFHEDLEGVMWVGTNKGVSRFHDGKFTSFTQANGLPAKAVGGILGDERGYLWFSMIAGLVRIDRREFDRAEADHSYKIRYSLYDGEDGLKGVPLFLGFPNATRGMDGRLWFVTTTGFVTVDPGLIHDNRPPPPPVVESATVDGRVLLPTPHLRLPPGSSELRIDYTSLSFAAPLKTRFRYKLEGVEPDWVEAGPRRQALYPNLPPADYHFRVSAATQGGDWADSLTVWDFSVAPRFYQTSWFAFACLGSIIASVCLAWRRRVTTVKRQVTLVYEERTRMAREIHDTLLQSLVGVALQFDIIARKLEASPNVAREHLVRVRDEVEQYIRETRQSIWDLRSPTLQTRDLAAALQHACANVTADHAVRCEFDVCGTPRRYPLRIEEQLMRIGLEALTNAVRHSGAQKIRLTLTYSASSVALGVTDDGCGFDPVAPPNGHGNHWGLAAMRERARQIGARFNLVTEPGGGTTIEALIPYRARVTEETTDRAEPY